jgi:hypothetical protein
MHAGENSYMHYAMRSAFKMRRSLAHWTLALQVLLRLLLAKQQAPSHYSHLEVARANWLEEHPEKSSRSLTGDSEGSYLHAKAARCNQRVARTANTVAVNELTIKLERERAPRLHQLLQLRVKSRENTGTCAKLCVSGRPCVFLVQPSKRL